jgi:hypothetical protein
MSGNLNSLFVTECDRISSAQCIDFKQQSPAWPGFVTASISTLVGLTAQEGWNLDPLLISR